MLCISRTFHGSCPAQPTWILLVRTSDEEPPRASPYTKTKSEEQKAGSSFPKVLATLYGFVLIEVVVLVHDGRLWGLGIGIIPLSTYCRVFILANQYRCRFSPSS